MLLEKAVDRAQAAGQRESQDEPVASALEGVADHHGRNGEKSKNGKRVHNENITASAALFTHPLCERPYPASHGGSRSAAIEETAMNASAPVRKNGETQGGIYVLSALVFALLYGLPVLVYLLDSTPR